MTLVMPPPIKVTRGRAANGERSSNSPSTAWAVPSPPLMIRCSIPPVASVATACGIASMWRKL
jgi:hypothetical protein